MADVNNEYKEREHQQENGTPHHNDDKHITNGHSNVSDFFDQIANTGATSNCDKLKECFDHFDVDGSVYFQLIYLFKLLIHLRLLTHLVTFSSLKLQIQRLSNTTPYVK